MPFYPYFCPYMNQRNDENDENDDLDFRSPNGFGPPFGPPSGGQGPGFGPPFGPPSGGQGPGFGPPFGPPSGGQSGPPSGPPPSITPTLQSTFGGPSIQAVDPGAIRPCRYQFVYIWPSYGRPFWAWLTFVGRRSVSGYRWNGYRWRYFGMDLRQIRSFQCF